MKKILILFAVIIIVLSLFACSPIKICGLNNFNINDSSTGLNLKLLPSDDFLFDYSDKDNIDWNDPLQHKKLIENLKIWYPNDINNHERADLQKSAANQEGNVPVSLGSVQELQEQIAQAEAAKKELEKKMRLAEEEKRLAEEILPRMNINNVNDPDNGIVSYHYEVYDARSVISPKSYII